MDLEQKLRQLFKNRSNCYADADDVVQAMDENCFIKTVKEALRIHNVVGRSEQLPILNIVKIDKLTIASELIIEATELKGKRPTQLNFEELIDVVESVVKKLTLPAVVGRSEQLVNFLLYLNDKELINNYDFDYEKEAKKYLKKK